MKFIFRYLFHHDVKSDHEIVTISFHSFFTILAYRDHRSHYLESIDQTLNISMLLLFTLYIIEVNLTPFHAGCGIPHSFPSPRDHPGENIHIFIENMFFDIDQEINFFDKQIKKFDIFCCLIFSSLIDIVWKTFMLSLETAKIIRIIIIIDINRA